MTDIEPSMMRHTDAIEQNFEFAFVSCVSDIDSSSIQSSITGSSSRVEIESKLWIYTSSCVDLSGSS
jgi:hypothetical protein